MNGFIEVHSLYDEEPSLVNLAYVEEIHTHFFDGMMRAIIYFAFNEPNSYEQDHIETAETYDEVKRLIEEATK